MKLTKRDISRIKECHPKIQKLFFSVAADEKCPNFLVVDGARTVEEQRRNVAKGVSKTMRSRHIPAKNGYSHAIDVAPFINGKLSWDWKDYYPLAKIIKQHAKKLNVPIEWGGDWKTFKDGPHWQLPWKEFPGDRPAQYLAEGDSMYIKEQTFSNKFKSSVDLVLKHEGGYVNHPDDTGGPTNKGITLKTFRRFIKPKGTIADLKKLTTNQARSIYKQQYWDTCSCNDLPLGIDHAVFDYSVNSGPLKARKALQKALGVPEDGRIGPKTIDAAKSHNIGYTIEILCSQRLKYLENRPNAKTFLNGWAKRVSRVKFEAQARVNTEVVHANKVAKPSGGSIFKLIFNIIGFIFGKR